MGVARALQVLSLALLQLSLAFPAQLPPPQKLSAEDDRSLTTELDRLRNLLRSANDPSSVKFQIARTYAAAGQYRDAMNWLQKVVDSNLGFDPPRDRLFAKLHGTKEFQSLMEEVRNQTPAISSSRSIGIVHEADLFPENFAYDPTSKTFFFGSTFKDEIARCDRYGRCKAFVPPHSDGLGYVLGLKLHQPSRTLWATSNTENGASLRHYNLASGELIRSYPLQGTHLFNDLAVSSSGDVFVTDSKEGSVYQLAAGGSGFERLAPTHTFTSANGIALSPDETTLFVADFGDGITTIDLASRSARPVPHSANISLGYIDGLYAMNGSLIAIQNGPVGPRIVRFVLSLDGRTIVAIKILEQRNPRFEGLTTGVLVGNRFYYVANSQIDKVVNGKIEPGAKIEPLLVLGIDLGP